MTDAIAIAPVQPDDPADRRRRILAIVGSSSGNLVEWYDFYTYAFFASYFAPVFFPKGDSTYQLLQTAGIFAVGFFMRPIGGWLFGRIADRLGRRTSMMISVLVMCAGSLAIALLPTFETVGALAPILLLLARMVQGLSVGGEYGTSATYMSEVAKKGSRGFYASFQYVTLIGGQLLASLVLVILQTFMTKEQLMVGGWRLPLTDWTVPFAGWRIAFVIGALAAVVALFLRSSLAETASKENLESKDSGTFSALFQHWRAFCVVLAYTAGGSLSFYTFTTYMSKYLINTAHINDVVATRTMTAALFVYMIIQPFFGWLSDRIGRKTSMIVYSTLTMVLVVPLMTTIGDVVTLASPVQNFLTSFMSESLARDWGIALLAFALVMTGMIAISFYTGISGIVKAELFPTHVRALGVGLSYAIANSLFGGTAEYVALWFKNEGMESVFPWYVATILGVAFVGSLIMPNPKVHGYLDGDGTVEEALGHKPQPVPA